MTNLSSLLVRTALLLWRTCGENAIMLFEYDWCHIELQVAVLDRYRFSEGTRILL